MVWIGLPDPGDSRIALEDQADLAVEAMGSLLTCWQRLDPERRGLTAAEVIALIFPKDTRVPVQDFHREMKAAIESLARRPDATCLGNLLRSYRRRIFAGCFIDQVSTKQRAARWAVFPTSRFQND